ncbi:hypothetical protein VTK73DRAFT_9580 [Phialemonium thermophilum]|uniref:Uncharacterized protein n=1 Tax=Phialemonium thermophilum TaxID=223376 RepID=A0ABR3XLA4_9PEZI
MPIPFLANIVFNGPPPWMPETSRILKVGSLLGTAALTKWYCTGATNKAERNMHGRVVMVTGGTSGVGQAVVFELAQRGAQIILLTHTSPAEDAFLVDYVEDLRTRTGNELIYAEQVDLASLHSIRRFATKWIDNAPPRRLDMIILCAATLTPPGGARTETTEGLESTWMVNYLANFHLLGILSPAIRAQPFDRDVRIILPTCSSYISAPPLAQDLDKGSWSPSTAYARSKLALMTFGNAYQKHLESYKRPDGLPMNARVVFVDPGYSRTPGTLRWLTRGSLLGLLFYILFYWIAWLVLKSPSAGAQSILFAALDASLGRGRGGKLIKECREVDFARRDVLDDEVAKRLWESSDTLIEKVEREQAVFRAKMKREQEEREREAKEAEKVEEIDSLVSAIRKGKEQEAKKRKKSRKSA